MELDLVVSGGTVLDPASGRTEVLDVGIASGTVAALGSGLADGHAGPVVDASGLLVTPGLVDIHVHSYAGASPISFDADAFCGATGVTTAVDAGSSGAVTFPGFRRHIAEQSRTRMLAFVHVAKYGAMRDPGELVDLRLADVDATAATIRVNREVAVGVKVRVADHHVGDNGPRAMELAIAAGDASGTPVMVHIGHSLMSIEEIVTTLRPGDIVTHCFTPLTPTLLDEHGAIRPVVLEAHERGVLFDVGPCDIDFDLDIARTCVDGGLSPDLISTDAYVNCFPRRTALVGGPADDEAFADVIVTRPHVDDLPGVLSMFLALGMSLADAIARATVAPAAAIGWADRLGRIEIGREADLAGLELVEGPVALRDSLGAEIEGNRILKARWSIRAGDVLLAEALPRG